MIERIARRHVPFSEPLLALGWQCGKDRLHGQLGVCRTGAVARVSSYGPHLGEEDPLRGWRGSGTIFFSRSRLRA